MAAHYYTEIKDFMFNGDFNAHSTLWGCRDKDLRGDFLTEHLVVHNLIIANLHNSDAIFEKLNDEDQVIATGWPDLSLVNSQTLPKLRPSFVSDTQSGLDHKYIHYTYHTTPLDTQRRLFNTTRGNFRKFNNIIK